MSIARGRRRAAGAALALVLFSACGGSGTYFPPDVILVPAATNVVAYWHDVGVATVNATASINTTPEEVRPAFHNDLATLHLAIYDAVSAIDGRYRPYAVTPGTPAAGASIDAAASAAAYGVLSALFPHRGAQYQAAYDSYLATIADGDGKARGLAVGAEVAAGIVARRANDGRLVELQRYVQNPSLGKFRGFAPINRYFPSIRPYTFTSIDQFRPGAPPALDSATYGADLNEVQALGGAVSAARTPEQFELARFHSEPPATFVTRNFGRFARTTEDVGNAARLMAIIYVGYADAINACYEAKYYYQTWRPQSAIELADVDPNPATTGDRSWTPSLPTPNYPEYPSADSCGAGALGESLHQYYGTDKVRFTFDSAVTGATRSYASTGALAEESTAARIYGGMNFRYSTLTGAELGRQVANWMMQQNFGPRH